MRNTALDTEIRWDDENRTLYVELAAARYMTSHLTDRKSSLYIRIQLLLIAEETPQTSKKKKNRNTVLPPLDEGNKNVMKEVLTRIRRDGKEIHFDERFQLTIREGALSDYALRFIACSIDRYSQLHISGETTVSLSHVTAGYQSNLSLVLKPPPQEPKGEVVLVLNYLPTAEKLSLTIKEWKGIKSLKNQKDSTVFFKISLIHEGCTIERRRSTSLPAALNASVNESFTFDVPGERLLDICFVINLHRRKTSSAGAGVSELVVGKLALGAEVELYDAQAHWNLMIANTRRSNVWTHPLR